MRKLFFNEYTDLNQEKFADMNDVRTFTKICIDTYNDRLQGQSQADANVVIRKKFIIVNAFGVYRGNDYIVTV